MSLQVYFNIHRHPTTTSGCSNVHKSTFGMYPSALTTASSDILAVHPTIYSNETPAIWKMAQFSWVFDYFWMFFSLVYTTTTPEIICHIWKSNVLKLQRLPHALPRFEREAAVKKTGLRYRVLAKGNCTILSILQNILHAIMRYGRIV